MGGLARHMMHIYENPSLTFKEIKDIFKKINDGNILVTEKADGQNLLLSYSVLEGKAKAARNQKNLIEGGLSLDNAASLIEVKEAQASFSEAIKLFEDTISKFSIEEQISIFGPNGNYYYNCEIQDPRNPNILNYDSKLINVHRTGHLKFNKFNKKITEEKLNNEFLKLETLLQTNSQINEQVSDGFILRTNPLRKLNPLKDKSRYENALKSLQNEMTMTGITDNASLAEYILNRLDEYLSENIPELSNESKSSLIKRLMKVKDHNAKNVYQSLNKTNNSHLIEKVKSILNSERKILKEAVSPIEQIITEFGAGVLKEFQSSYIKESDREIKRLKEKLQEIFDIVGNSGNVESQNFFNNEFKKIKDINNINSACEGIVFKYSDDVYKITGLFSPLNQILGMMNYSRGKSPPLKTLITMSEDKKLNDTAVVSWGRFNPPTIGHEVVFKFGNEFAKQNKGDFFIVPSKTVDNQKNPLTIQEKISYLNKIFPEYNSNITNSSQINTIIEVAKHFSSKGYKNFKLIVGSDRKSHFEEVLNKYNNKDYKFNSIEIISAGERLDEGEGAASMSASKMRAAAIEGDIDSFMKGVAGRLELEEGVELMNLIRSRIEVVEDGKKKVLSPISPSLLAEVIKKSGNKWCLLSKSKTKNGKRKKLDCYNSLTGAKKRERQVQYFKHIKEEQDLEENNAVSAGGVQGFAGPFGKLKNREIELEENEEEVAEIINVYNQSQENRLGRGFGKRDDEQSKKDVIKVLIMQEEQFMINRKEFVEEIKLRKIIREGIKYKIKEREEKNLQEEKELRLVIKKLLQEKDEEPPHPITGINVLRDLLKKIVPTIENSYKQLTTNDEQRKSFRAHLVKKTKDLITATETPEENVSVDVALKEQELEELQLSPARQAAKQDPRFIDPFAKKNQPEPELKPEPVVDDGLDTTGRDMSEKTFNKIQKQIKDAYDILSDQRDKDAFSEYLMTNELMHMDIFEDDMKTAVSEPTTPSYEKEKTKIDSTTPEADTTSQLPSSDPEQTPPISPNPLGENKKKKR